MAGLKTKTIDEYLERLSDDKRAALERVRETIRAAAPGAEECISYQMPAFCLDGKAFIWFAAGAKHCSIYGVAGIKDELKSYDTRGKGTLRFQADHPPPAALVRKIVIARLAKVAGGPTGKR